MQISFPTHDSEFAVVKCVQQLESRASLFFPFLRNEKYTKKENCVVLLFFVWQNEEKFFLITLNTEYNNVM